MTLYAIFLAAALLVNIGNQRMTLLSLAVGTGIFMPIQDGGFYFICSAVEVAVALSAVLLRADASKPVLRISGILITLHMLGWWLNGYPPASPYHILVKLCEHAELLACIVLSKPMMKRLHHA